MCPNGLGMVGTLSWMDATYSWLTVTVSCCAFRCSWLGYAAMRSAAERVVTSVPMMMGDAGFHGWVDRDRGTGAGDVHVTAGIPPDRGAVQLVPFGKSYGVWLSPGCRCRHTRDRSRTSRKREWGNTANPQTMAYVETEMVTAWAILGSLKPR